MKVRIIKKFENFDSDGEMEDHGRYYMKGNTYVPKHQETEYTQMTEDIKNVFNDIVDLGSQYSVSYVERWYLTEVIITLDKTLFVRDQKYIRMSGIKQMNNNIKKDLKIINRFCEEEIDYRLERIEDLFGTKPSMAGGHLLINKDGKYITYKYPNWENVYVVENRLHQSIEEYTFDGYEIHMFFGSVQKKLPHGIKARPLRKIDKEGRYVD